MDCYTGLLEEYREKHPDATGAEVDAYVDSVRAANAAKAQAEAADDQPGDSK
jgi:hypothetical protein